MMIPSPDPPGPAGRCPRLPAARVRVPGVIWIARVGRDEDRAACPAGALAVGRTGLAALQLAGGFPVTHGRADVHSRAGRSGRYVLGSIDGQAGSGALRLVTATTGSVARFVAANAINAIERHAVECSAAGPTFLEVASTEPIAGAPARAA